MDINELVTRTHAAVTAGVPSFTGITYITPLPEPKPEPPLVQEPRTIPEAVVFAIASGANTEAREAYLRERLGDHWLAAALECSRGEAPLIHDIDTLTSGGAALARANGWLPTNPNPNPNPTSERNNMGTETIIQAIAANARAAVAALRDNLGTTDDCAEALALEEAREGGPRKTVLAAIRKSQQRLEAAEDAALAEAEEQAATVPPAVAEAAAAVEAPPVPPTTRTLAEVKEMADAILSERVSQVLSSNCYSKGPDAALMELCRAVLSVPDAPTRKARKARAATEVQFRVDRQDTIGGLAEGEVFTRNNRHFHIVVEQKENGATITKLIKPDGSTRAIRWGGGKDQNYTVQVVEASTVPDYAQAILAA